VSPTDTRDDRDAALSRNRARHEAREQAADDLCNEPVDLEAFGATDSVLRIYLRTAKGRKWAEDHTLDGLSFEPLLIEHRFGPALLLGAYQDGLTVSLDGRLADA
jgi:hypothetical protein